jgi:hypothetical protein
VEHVQEPHSINNRLKRIDHNSTVFSCQHEGEDKFLKRLQWHIKKDQLSFKIAGNLEICLRPHLS